MEVQVRPRESHISRRQVSVRTDPGAVVAKLPKGLPYAQPCLLFTDALFICRRFEMDSTLTTSHAFIAYIISEQISSRVGLRMEPLEALGRDLLDC
jgi:hypothetical protein